MKYPSPIPNSTITRVILVRHGRSTYNEQGRYQGSSDEAVLTDQGHQDAYRTGVALQHTSLDAIYSSPLQRAQQTVQDLKIALRDGIYPLCETRIHSHLREIHLPEWAGLPYHFVRKNLTNDYRCWIERPHEFQMGLRPQPQRDKIGLKLLQPQSFFPVRRLYEQAQQFWQEVLPHHAGQTILVVSHGGTIRALLATALGLPCQHYHRLQQSNCGISILDFPNTAHPVQLVSMNDTHHLGEASPKLKEGKQGLRLILGSIEALNPRKLEALRAQLSPIELQFCVSNGDRAQAMADDLLRDRPHVLQLSTTGSDAHYRWLQSLQARQRPTSGDAPLMTGLMIASPEALEQTLSHIAGVEDGSKHSFFFHSSCLSMIHFPNRQRSPILQSLNFAHSQNLLQPLNQGECYPCAS